MRFRRLTGSLLTLLTLHLNILGADFACAKHGSASSPEHGANAHMMSMPATEASDMQDAMHGEHSAHVLVATVASDVPEFGNDKPPCDVPVQPNCCKALASCSIVFSAANELEIASALNLSELIAPRAITTPPSERAAPEPPPPKA